MAKKGVYKISGNSKPKVGEKTFFNVDEWYPSTPHSERNLTKVYWELFIKDESGNGFRTTNIKKKGINHFTFGKNAHKFIYKVEGYLHEPEGNSPMSMIVQPQKDEIKPKAKEKDILGVSLTYQDGSKISKPLSYKDQLKATAKCDGMVGESIVFNLWEDDSEKAGHHKNNQYITKSPAVKVNKYGKAEWIFSLSPTFITLANKKEDEKKQHEYYVTAEYNGRVDASGNVNVNNPEIPKPIPSPSKPKPKPKENTAKFPSSSSSPKRNSDPKGKILSAEFVNGKGEKISSAKIGNTVSIKITSKNMVGKVVMVRIYEDDNFNDDFLLGKKVKISNDIAFINNVKLTNDMYDEGKRWEVENKTQHFFIEVEHLSISTESQRIGVSLNEEPKKIENPKSPAKQEGKNAPKTNSTCLCQKEDLVWSDKIGCKERQKVMEVSKNLGVDPNWLMTVIALETAETFSPSIDNGIGYVGLIQFGADAAKDVGTTQSALIKMSFVDQMKYVEKHLTKNKSKFKTLADLYLAVLYPSASGKGSDRDYVVLEGKAYQSNPLFFKEKGEWEWATKVNKKGKTIKFKKAVDPDGKTHVWEIAMVAQDVYTRGLAVKEKSFTCNNSKPAETPKTGDCLDTWDTATNNRIAKLHPKIRCAVKNFINEVDKTLGIKLRVIQGFRTYAEQNTLYAQGRTTKGKKVTNAKGGQSNHNFGLAIDVAEIKNGNIDWNEQETVLPKIAPIGKKWGFEWGGDWKSIKDKPHFEMMFGKSLADLRKSYEENGKDHTKIPL